MLKEFISDRNLSPSSIRNYASAVRIYEELNNKTLKELIDEAEREELEKIRWKDRKIRKRLINYRSYLYKNKVETTAVKYLTNIQTIYRHFEIELHTLPTFRSKQINKSKEIKFKDLPTKENIQDACKIADEVTELIILFITTSGLSKIEILNLTVEDFIKANKSEIPTFYLTRKKKQQKSFSHSQHQKLLKK